MLRAQLSSNFYSVYGYKESEAVRFIQELFGVSYVNIKQWCYDYSEPYLKMSLFSSVGGTNINTYIEKINNKYGTP